MHTLNHKVKIVELLMVGHHNWVVDKDTKENEVKEAKELVKEVLKPGRHPGGSKEDNIGKNINDTDFNM